jgi:hypothetical protein
MASLTLAFDRDTLSEGFYLETEVTAATDIDLSCLVAVKGTASTPETIVRIATLEDLAGIAEAPAGGYLHLWDPAFAGAAPIVTDIVRVTSVPAMWTEKLGYVLGDHVVDDVDILANRWVRVSAVSPFPSYGTGISFKIYNATLTTLKYTGVMTGTATRDLYTDPAAWNPRTHYRMPTSYSVFSALETAINKLISLRTQAQSLVDNTALYLDSYDGSGPETFTS